MICRLRNSLVPKNTNKFKLLHNLYNQAFIIKHEDFLFLALINGTSFNH